MSKVAVVIPAYNAAVTLGKTLHSVLQQTMGDFEALVTDDGSTDRTFEVASEFARRDNRFRVVRQPNRGLAEARNSGIRHTQAPLIAALDSDDLWHETFLQKLLGAFQRGGRDTVMAYANSRVIDMQDRVLRDAPSFRNSGWVFNQLLLENFIGNGSAMMFRRDLAVQLGAYDARLHYEFGAQGCEDWLLALRLAARGQVAAVREYLVGYRASPGAMSENRLTMRRSRLAALQLLRGEVPHYNEGALRWALGTAHTKCFLHEIRSRQYGLACKSLHAALRADFMGTWHLLIGPERFSWLARRIPQRALSDEQPLFQDCDPLDGQWEYQPARAATAKQWDLENGRIVTSGVESDMAEINI